MGISSYYGGCIFGHLNEESFTITQLSERSGMGPVNLFTHDLRGLSVEVPGELEIKSFDEGGGAETVVFQHPTDQLGFQIFILPYKGEQITEDRILKDIPSGVVKDPQEVVIGKRGDIRAMAFVSENPIMGETREVWFIHDGYLYEVTTYLSYDEWIADIMDTVSFE